MCEQSSAQKNAERLAKAESENQVGIINERIARLEDQLKIQTALRQKAESQTESQARAKLEVEQKLKTVSEKLAGLEQRLIDQIEAGNRTEALLKNEQHTRIEAEQKIQVERQAKNQLEQQLQRYSEQFNKAKEKTATETLQKTKVAITAAAQVKPQLTEPANIPTGARTCECCGKDNVKETELLRIDSGRAFLPRLLPGLKKRLRFLKISCCANIISP